MTRDELFEQLSLKGKDNRNIALPNELYPLLLQWSQEGLIKSTHIGLTWSYLYLVTFLYRYAIYDRFLPNTEQIKVMLGYSAKDCRIDYLIKKNGLLDQHQLTESTNNFPVHVETVQNGLSINPQFTHLLDFDKAYVKQYKTDKKIGRTSYCKKPLFAFNRQPYEQGTFYDISNTTLIPYKVFEFCMRKDDLGCTAFYIYSYLVHMNDVYESDFKCTTNKLAKQIGLSEKTITRYMNVMRGYRMLDVQFNMKYFTLNWADGEFKASNLLTNTYTSFSTVQVPYKKLPFKTQYEHQLHEYQTGG